MSSQKSCPGFIECCHQLSHQSIKEHRDKYSNDGYILDLYLQSQMEIVTKERLLDDYNKVEIQSIIPLELNNSDNGLIMSSSPPDIHTRCSFDDYKKEKSALIMRGLGVEGRLIPYIFDHLIHKKSEKKGNRYSMKSIFSCIPQQQPDDKFVAFRYPKTVDVHTLRSITIRLLIGLSPPYLKQQQVSSSP